LPLTRKPKIEVPNENRFPTSVGGQIEGASPT
jgi:hypothetical protein